MTVQDFVEKAKVLTLEELEEFITTKCVNKLYVPFSKKEKVCDLILEMGMYGGDRVSNSYNPNSVLVNKLFKLYLIDLYTDIDIDFENKEEEYDLLDQYNCLDICCSTSRMGTTAIPSLEIENFVNILNYKHEDIQVKESSLVDFFDRKLAVLEVFVTQFLDQALSRIETGVKEQFANGDFDKDNIVKFMAEFNRDYDKEFVNEGDENVNRDNDGAGNVSDVDSLSDND